MREGESFGERYPILKPRFPINREPRTSLNGLYSRNLRVGKVTTQLFWCRILHEIFGHVNTKFRWMCSNWRCSADPDTGSTSMLWKPVKHQSSLAQVQRLTKTSCGLSVWCVKNSSSRAACIVNREHGWTRQPPFIEPRRTQTVDTKLRAYLRTHSCRWFPTLSSTYKLTQAAT